MSSENNQSDEKKRGELTTKILDIAMKLRIYREWQKSSLAMSSQFSDREILVIELIRKFGPLTGDAIVRILGLSPSSVSEIVRDLSEKKLIKKIKGATDDQRERLLAFNDSEAEKALKEFENLGIVRYEYIISKIPAEQLGSLSQLLDIMGKTITTKIMADLFDKYK